MHIHKMTTCPAFIAWDFEGVPASGVTRLARKVLQDGAASLARTTTYSFASFGIQMCGASAGINADGEGRDDAVAAFVSEARELVENRSWTTDPALGLTEADFAPIREVDPRPAPLWDEQARVQLAAAGAVAAAGAAIDGDSARCAAVGGGPAVEAARAEAEAVGMSWVDGVAPDVDADVLFVAGKAGALEHEAAVTVRARTVVPLTPLAVTARAHAELSKKSCVHVPDFLSTAAPLLAAHAADAGDPADAIRSAVSGFAGAGTGMWLAAVEAAEQYLHSWRDELPFGRPLA